MILLQVKDWGSGRQEDLGELQVESHREFDQDHTKPFYEQLARRLELLQVKPRLVGDEQFGSASCVPVGAWSWQGCDRCSPQQGCCGLLGQCYLFMT